MLEPTFGGINLEDIKAPECFEIEEELRRTMKIPVFHDDQHGTAIISGAALLNALELAGKQHRGGEDRLQRRRRGRALLRHALRPAGRAAREHHHVRHHGVIYKGRTEGMNEYKERFASTTDARTLAEALVGADVFFGLSAATSSRRRCCKAMAPNPIIFALANPDPEITYDVAVAARPDAIMATGRSDYPNQVNNVLGFPFIFRGALDVRATTINDEMKLAATRALAALAKEDVPDSVRRAYGVERMEFGREYIIPKPFDPRVLIWEASAVAQAAMETGVAQQPVDIEEYREQLAAPPRQGRRSHARHDQQGAAGPQARRLPGRRREQDPARLPDPARREDRQPDPARQRRRRSARWRRGPAPAPGRRPGSSTRRSSPLMPAYTEEFYRLRQRKGDHAHRGRAS